MAKADSLFDILLSAPAALNPSITVHTETQLEQAQLYRFKISAVNFVREGPVSEEISVISADMPQQPTNPPVVTLFTETSISIYLEPVADAANGGSDVTGYIVQIDDGLGGDYLTVHDSLEQSLILT